MKKYYKNSVKRTLKKNKPKPKFNKAQLEFYESFFKDTDRLEREWNLCKTQYAVSVKFVREKGIKFDTKMALQKIAKYWNTRKLAMEKAIGNEMLKEFKERRDATIKQQEEKPDENK